MLALTACHTSTEPVVGDSSLTVANATLGYARCLHRRTPGDVWRAEHERAFELVQLAGGRSPHTTERNWPESRLPPRSQWRRRPFALQTLVVYPTPSGEATGPATTVLVDSGTYVPTGKSQLRVANLAAGAGAIEIWRSQPGSTTGNRIMTPLASGTASPYCRERSRRMGSMDDRRRQCDEDGELRPDRDSGVWPSYRAAPRQPGRPAVRRRRILIVLVMRRGSVGGERSV